MAYNEDLVRDSIDRLPFTMAVPLARAVLARSRGDYKETLINLLDFFEMSVQWLNCFFIASASADAALARHKGVQRAVAMIDAKRPLSFGDNVNELFGPMLEAIHATDPGHPLSQSLTTHVKTRRRDILVGSARETGIIKIRNDYKGHSTSLAQGIYRGVVEEIDERVDKMLLGLRPLCDADIHIATPGGKLPVKGTSAPIGMAEGPDARYTVAFAGRTPVDLYPMIILRGGRYVAVFQTLKDEAVKYESSDENLRGFETEAFNADFDAMMQRIVPSFDIAKEANWDELRMAMRRHSTQFMVQVQKEKKYNSELFVDRARLTGLLERFSESEATLFMLPGEAGQGKTNQLCYWTERFLDAGEPVMIFSSASFAEATLADTLRGIFGISRRRPLSRLLDSLHEKAEQAGKNVYFFFDAINECLHYSGSDAGADTAPALLFAEIASTLVDTRYRRFKTLATCRVYTWKNQIMPTVSLPSGLMFGHGDSHEDITVRGFTDSETETAYRIYGELYQMSTPFEELDRRIMLRLRDPLILKFVCSNYVGQRLSDDAGGYTSVVLFEKMIRDIRDSSFAGRRQCELLDELSRIFLEAYLHGHAVDSISNRALREAYADPSSPLHTLAGMVYKKDGLTVAYTELRNKPDRPILRESRKQVGGEELHAIEFIYERFAEYMMARAFVKKHSSAEGIPIAAEAYVEAFAGAAVNVVFIGAMRNAMLIDMLRTGDYSALCRLITEHADNADVMQLVNETVDALIHEYYEPQTSALVGTLLDARPDDPEIIGRFNKVQHDIAANRADATTIADHNRLSSRLAPTIRMRSMASVITTNMLLTDYFNEDLYADSPLHQLWRLVNDDITDVSNEACKFIYYLSHRTHTHSYIPLRDNITERIVKEMYAVIKSRTIAGNMAVSRLRHQAVTFVETATRLATLLIIDATMATPQNTAMISGMLAEIRSVAAYFTWDFRLVRLLMPFLQSIMRKQITFQSIYVNNAVEYQGFWNPDIVAPTADAQGWSRSHLDRAMEFVGLYQRHYPRFDTPECRAEIERFREFHPSVLAAYATGCSFSYFIIERMLVIVGCADWGAVRDIFATLLKSPNRHFEWFDYMQMSLLYDLFQIEVNSSESNPEIQEIYAREARDWTLRCRGHFKARHSHKANSTGLYKRNVINWYCVVYSAHIGDGAIRPGDTRPVPLLYDLIDEAIGSSDKELLMHLIDNISELISDFGYIGNALGALKYIMVCLDSTEKVAAIDAAADSRRDGDDGLVREIGKVLSTAKNYFPAETDAFIKSDIVGLTFPGVSVYRDEILNYHPGGETLSDLFTHKFGNFLLWSLLHEKTVVDFADTAICTATGSKDCFEWFDKVIRILCREMFDLKLKL